MTGDKNAELLARLRNLDCAMVEICRPHSGNPSDDIIPISRSVLIQALTPASPVSREGAKDRALRLVRDLVVELETWEPETLDYLRLMPEAALLREWIAKSATLPNPASGGDFVLVPREPTEAMIRAVDKAAMERWPNARKMAEAMHAAILAVAAESAK